MKGGWCPDANLKWSKESGLVPRVDCAGTYRDVAMYCLNVTIQSIQHNPSSR